MEENIGSNQILNEKKQIIIFFSILTCISIIIVQCIHEYKNFEIFEYIFVIAFIDILLFLFVMIVYGIFFDNK